MAVNRPSYQLQSQFSQTYLIFLEIFYTNADEMYEDPFTHFRITILFTIMTLAYILPLNRKITPFFVVNANQDALKLSMTH